MILTLVWFLVAFIPSLAGLDSGFDIFPALPISPSALFLLPLLVGSSAVSIQPLTRTQSKLDGSARRSSLRVSTLLLALAMLVSRGLAQEPEIERTGPPAVDDLEKDSNRDGVPDGWYNARDAIWETKGGIVGPHFIRFECTQRGRPARLSRAFGVDGRKTEAIILGLWVKLNNIQYGERGGEEPSLLIDFLGDGLRHLSRGTMGPWTHTIGSQWTRVAKRIAVPPGTRDAIMSVGLLGAKGILDMDGLTVDLVPAGEAATTNLVVNGDFELGDPAPAYWIVNNDAYRVFPGHRSGAAIELGTVRLAGADRRWLCRWRASGALRALPLRRGKEPAGQRRGGCVVLLPRRSGTADSREPMPSSGFGWAGSFDWRREVAEVPRSPRSQAGGPPVREDPMSAARSGSMM